jgi:hypothetical protein|tara:strand:+ start:1700 stop:2065 length:366 start_codon:yes stop_codon:yes gene_type:complete
MKQLQSLDNYFTEVDDMFDEAKKEHDFKLFTKTCKRTINLTIDVYSQYSKKTIEEIYEKGDSYEMMFLMDMLQNKITELIIKGKVANEIYSSIIKQMNNHSEIDSTLAKGDSFKIFIENEL